jgi:hypothetical protein
MIGNNMNLLDNIVTLTEEIATMFVSVYTKLSGNTTGDLSGLTTTDKTSLLAAVNELKAQIGIIWTNEDGDLCIGSETDHTKFTAEGHQIMIGDARPWRDQLTDAINIKSTGTGVSVNSTESTMDFVNNANLNDYLFFNVQLNHDKDLSASIYPHIHFFQAEAQMPNFLLQYRWHVNGGLKTTAWTNLKCNSRAFDNPAGGQTRNQIAYSAAITIPAGSTISDIVQFRILRDTGNASTAFTGTDPYTATVGVLAFDIHFMTDSLGSNEEYEKT